MHTNQNGERALYTVSIVSRHLSSLGVVFAGLSRPREMGADPDGASIPIISIGDIRDCTINPNPEDRIGADAKNRYRR